MFQIKLKIQAKNSDFIQNNKKKNSKPQYCMLLKKVITYFFKNKNSNFQTI